MKTEMKHGSRMSAEEAEFFLYLLLAFISVYLCSSVDYFQFKKQKEPRGERGSWTLLCSEKLTEPAR
jgi:hypothetical protein